VASKREAILAYLIATLFPSITVANGYGNTVGLVMRGQRNIDDLADTDFPFICIMSTLETRKNITKTTFHSELQVDVVGAVKSPDGISGNQTAMDSLMADLTKCVMADHTQGGLVMYTEVRRIKTDNGDMDTHALFVAEIYFRYATEGTNP
jgi:hypothetical protein